MKLIPYLVLFLIISACKNEANIKRIDPPKTTMLQLKYAKGFSVTYHDGYKVLQILKPWPKAKKTYSYAITNTETIIDFKSETFNATIDQDVNKIVVTSTTHIPALELLGVEQALVGFPGTDYISSEKTRQRINNGKIRELGKNEGINTEVLLEIDPDLVVGFGVEGVNKTFETIKKAGIPVIYNGDWVESSALAKAEWIKLFGVLFNKEKEADSIFNTIEKDYLAAKAIAKKAKTKPTILSGAMHKELWYLPNGASAEAQFLKDANVNYLWSNTAGNGSLALSFEAVLVKAKTAEFWFNPSYYASLKQLETANTLYTTFDAFKNKTIFSSATTVGATGGVLYYEFGTARPDLVLKDIIKICHPELLPDYTTYFFKPLN